MEKIKIDSLEKKSWRAADGTVRDFVEIHSGGFIYSCWQKSVFESLKVGDEVEGEVIQKGAGKTPQLRIASVNGVAVASSGGGGGKQGFQAQRIESFAAAYAKDIAVAFIAKGNITNSQEAISTIDRFYDVFLGKMKKE